MSVSTTHRRPRQDSSMSTCWPSRTPQPPTPQDVSATDLVPKRMKLLAWDRPWPPGTAHTARHEPDLREKIPHRRTHRAPPKQKYTSTKQRPFSHRCPRGSSSTTAASDAHPARHPLPSITGYRARCSRVTPIRRFPGPGRASPGTPPPLSIRSNTPYAEESFGACT